MDYDNQTNNKHTDRLFQNYENKPKTTEKLSRALQYDRTKNHTPNIRSSLITPMSGRIESDHVESFKDQLIKLKTEYNKRIKEINALKIENYKLNEDNLRNLKLIESILNKSGRSIEQLLIENEMTESQDLSENNQLFIGLDKKDSNKLKQAFLITSLKKQIVSLKRALSEKEEENQTLRLNTKVIRYTQLESNYHASLNEHWTLKKENEHLKSVFEELSTRLRAITEERDYNKALLMKLRTNFDETKKKIRNYEEELKRLTEIKKNQEEKINYLQKSHNFKNLMKEKNTLVSDYKSEGVDRERIDELQKINKQLKADIEKNKGNLSQYMKKIEALTKENKDLNEKMKNESDKFKSFNGNKEKIGKMEKEIKEKQEMINGYLKQIEMLKNGKGNHNTNVNVNTNSDNEKESKNLNLIKIEENEKVNEINLNSTNNNKKVETIENKPTNEMNSKAEPAKKQTNNIKDDDEEVIDEEYNKFDEDIAENDVHEHTASNKKDEIIDESNDLKNKLLQNTESKHDIEEEIEEEVVKNENNQIKTEIKQKLNETKDDIPIKETEVKQEIEIGEKKIETIMIEDEKTTEIKEKHENIIMNRKEEEQVKEEPLVKEIGILKESKEYVNNKIDENINKDKQNEDVELKEKQDEIKLNNRQANNITELKEEVSKVKNESIKSLKEVKNKSRPTSSTKNKSVKLVLPEDTSTKEEVVLNKNINNQEEQKITQTNDLASNKSEESLGEHPGTIKHEASDSKPTQIQTASLGKDASSTLNPPNISIPIVTERSKERNSTVKYSIKITHSDTQNLDPSNPFYIANFERRPTKSKSNVIKDKEIIRAVTIDKLLTEKIKNNEDFDKIIEDPKIKNLLEK